MQYECAWRPLAESGDWEAFCDRLALGRGSRSSPLLGSLVQTFRDLGARCCLDEQPYIDRDFSALYSAFYAGLYQSFPKYCRRLHFFTCDLSEFQVLSGDPNRRATYLEAHRADYLGYIVIRPLRHAPVSNAVVSACHLTNPAHEICIRSRFHVHLLGAELSVEGAAITEQDKMNGVCAQAAMWMAHRHLHNRHSSQWLATTDITRAALRTLDTRLARALPAGSETLGADNMAMAFREAGENPLVYVPAQAGGKSEEPLLRTVTRYLDSGVPVIMGLRDGRESGHSVMAVGLERSATQPQASTHPNAADRVTHILVNNDQDGAYLPLPVNRSPEGGGYSLANADVVFVLLPKKVHMRAEHAERLARESVEAVSRNRLQHVIDALGDQRSRWVDDVDPTFHGNLESLVARTYLTYGWKYKQRIVRGDILDDIKYDILQIQLPRYVWVTEFSLPADAEGHNQTAHRIRGHVVIDATGSPYWGSLIITHVPGVAVLRVFDPGNPRAGSKTVAAVFQTDRPYLPKVRGWDGRDRIETGLAKPAAASGTTGAPLAASLQEVPPEP